MSHRATYKLSNTLLLTGYTSGVYVLQWKLGCNCYPYRRKLREHHIYNKCINKGGSIRRLVESYVGSLLFGSGAFIRVRNGMFVSSFTQNKLATKLMHFSCPVDSVFFTLATASLAIMASNNSRVCCLHSLMVQLTEQKSFLSYATIHYHNVMTLSLCDCSIICWLLPVASVWRYVASVSTFSDRICLQTGEE